MEGTEARALVDVAVEGTEARALVDVAVEGTEASVLKPIFEDDEREFEALEIYDEDVEMLDADSDGVGDDEAPAIICARGGDEAPAIGGGYCETNPNRNATTKKKKRRNKKNRKRNRESAPNITDINRFVIDACRHLKEKKSYLVWNAVGCLGVSAVSDLVKEVDGIQNCGGQKTVDGSRPRTGGGILWNILKTREPKAYKEIMAKGREFEKQLWQPKKKQKPNMNEAEAPQNAFADDVAVGGEDLDSCDTNKGRTSVRDRIRVPVSYVDLFEEGEIRE